jgi:bifunctional enzyme CysN/CysC
MAAEQELIRTDIEGYLERYQNKELLRIVAVGSVDDGKSTLIGRLLHDTGMVYEDQLAAVRRASAIPGEEIDFSLLTDGLMAEREQGITIDVAYRYFATEKRKFIVADTPGHVQYTRNMATGASTANVAIILIDARLGVLQQSRRHAYIASLLGIPHLLVCVNKMDLVGYDREVFDRIRATFLEFAGKLRFKAVSLIPISALKGANIVARSPHTPWYDGPTVLEKLETVPAAADRNVENFRFPVQTVLRPDLDYRGFAAQVASGRVAVGDEVMVLPAGTLTRVKAIDTFDGTHAAAHTPQSVVLRLAHEVDCSRGDMIVHPTDLPKVGRTFSAHLVWLNAKPLDLQKTYLVKHTTQEVRAQIEQVEWKLDLDTLAQVPAAGLELNEIAKVRVTCHRALYYDAYEKNRETGAFIVIDSLTNNTVGAGMIMADERRQSVEEAVQELRAGSALQPKTQVSPRERFERMGQRGVTVWLTGVPGSGRWLLAFALERRLFDLGRTATVIEPTGEDLHTMIAAAKAGTDAGLVTICAYPSSKRDERHLVHERVGTDRFVLVHVNTDRALCRVRRPDADFDSYEPPVNPDVTIALDQVSLDQAIDVILGDLERRGFFKLETAG